MWSTRTDEDEEGVGEEEKKKRHELRTTYKYHKLNLLAKPSEIIVFSKIRL